MIHFFINLNPIMQTFIATIFTWFVTLLGSATVYLFRKVNNTILDSMLGLSSGVMLASSYWSLLAPSISHAKGLGMNPIISTVCGFILGGILIYIGDIIFRKFEFKFSNIKRSILIFSSITLHNIPEGLAIGVAFGSIMYHIEGSTLYGAIMLAIGIGIQNFPEGMSVSLPLKRDGFSNNKSFFYGQLSGIVEPISAVLGALLVLKIRYILPFLLAFAAGSMIYVVVKELIPESQTNKNKNLVTMTTLIGFSIMMILDVLLG